MSVFALQRASQFEAVLAARILARTQSLTDIEPGSVLRQIIGAAALGFEIGSFNTAQLLQLFSIYAAQGADLDARAQDYLPVGIGRSGASRATGTVQWSRAVATASAVVIPAGTRFARPGSNPPISYVTTAPGWIPAGGTQDIIVGPGITHIAVIGTGTAKLFATFGDAD
jgi:subtilisin family serine protease